MKKLRIAVVAGGDSTERDISMRGAAYLMNELNRDIYDLTLVTVSREGWFATAHDGKIYPIDKNDFSFTEDNGRETVFEFAVIIIHGTPGENGILQGYFDLLGIPYSTSGVLSSALTFDKSSAKAIAEKAGAKVAKEIVICKGDTIEPEKIAKKLGLPLFVKPNGAGSSFGVTKVKRTEDISDAVENAFTEDCRVIMEEFLEGREVSCGIFKALDKEYVLPVTEIISQSEFFDYKAKYQGNSQEITPADLPEDTVKKLNEETRRIYRALACESLVRIDFIIKEGTPYMIEVNSIPGMSPQSIVPQQLKAMGMSTGGMYDLIIADKMLKKNGGNVH